MDGVGPLPRTLRLILGGGARPKRVEAARPRTLSDAERLMNIGLSRDEIADVVQFLAKALRETRPGRSRC
jgi:hypothetical protein